MLICSFFVFKCSHQTHKTKYFFQKPKLFVLLAPSCYFDSFFTRHDYILKAILYYTQAIMGFIRSKLGIFGWEKEKKR